MHMQTQSMTVEDGSKWDHIPAILNQIRSWDLSEKIWALWNEE